MRSNRKSNVLLRARALLFVVYSSLAACLLDSTAVQAQEEGYSGSRLADGWIAIGTGVSKPFSTPIDRVEDCWQEYHADDPVTPYLLATGCAAYGLGEGIVIGACNVVAGVLDVVTFGIFEISRQTGVIE